jgi:glycosyltransferase involved in cell wall biosynthesis
MTNSFETGGSERQFAVLAQGLSSDQFKVHLGCIRREGAFAAAFGDVPEFRLGGSLFGWKSLRARLRLRSLLRREEVQIAHAFDFYSNLTLIPAARMARLPVLLGSQRQLGDLLTPRQFRAQAAVFRWCDAVVCNSQAAADRLAEEGLSREKLVVIGNALPAETFARSAPILPRQPGVVRVGMVARMNARYKNHSGFLRIAARIRQQIPQTEFLLAGEGPLRPELEREAQSLGLGTSAKFLGDCRDVPAVLAAMDVAVLTSDSESLSNVILEAMAAGLPVVAFRVGGNAEIVNEQRGVLVAAGDEGEFAGAVQQLLTSPQMRMQMGQIARKFVEENFSLDTVRAKYQHLYESLLKKKRERN